MRLNIFLASLSTEIQWNTQDQEYSPVVHPTAKRPQRINRTPNVTLKLLVEKIANDSQTWSTESNTAVGFNKTKKMSFLACRWSDFYAMWMAMKICEQVWLESGIWTVVLFLNHRVILWRRWWWTAAYIHECLRNLSRIGKIETAQDSSELSSLHVSVSCIISEKAERERVLSHFSLWDS